MDAALLARIQFAVTVGYHFIFAPLTIGLSWFIVGLMTRYWRTGSMDDRNLARFWIRLFSINFAVGVATGIAMEFQFGTNWATYSKYVGDIFGPPLASEVIFTFFLESTFIAVLLLGWDRVSRRAHWFSALMVALGSTMSAFWIISANSWMQTPAGYTLVDGRPVLSDFWAAIINYSTIPRFLHTLNAALMTGAFFVLGINAWFLLKQRHVAAARRMVMLALVVAFVTSVAQLGLGHYHAIQVADTQPTKLAAFEGLFQTQRYAPLLLFGIIDGPQRTVHYAIRLPAGLSLLARLRPDAEIAGLDQTPEALWPPLPLTFYPFHLMVLIGLFCIAFPALGLLLNWKRWLDGSRWFYLVAVLAIPLPFLANELGWMTTEVGRQPWIVYHLILTRDAISPNVPASYIVFSMIGLGVLYTVFTVFWLGFMGRELHRGPESVGETPAEGGTP